MKWKKSDDIRTRSGIKNNIKEEPAIEIYSTLYENGEKLVELESDIEDFCAVMETLKYEDLDTDDQKPDLLSVVHKIPKSKQSFEFSKLISESLCRLCATSSDSMVSILDRNESEDNIIDWIEYCFPIRVKNADSLPKKICQLCLEKLELCYQFHKTVAEAEKRFLMFNDGEVNEERLETLSALHNESQILPKKLETTDTAVIANETVPPNTKLQNAKRKTRSSSRQNQTISDSELNLEESGRICRDTGVVENEAVPQNAKIQTEKRRTRSQALAGDDLEESRRSGRLPSIPEFVFPQIISNHTESDSVEEEARNDDGDDDIVTRKTVPNGENIEAKIISCRICDETFKTAKEGFRHSSIHASTNYYPCCLCSEILLTEKDWYKHELKHEEGKILRREVEINSRNKSQKKCPGKEKAKSEKLKQKIGARKNLKCNKCNETMDSKRSSHQHMITVHKQHKKSSQDLCQKELRISDQLSGPEKNSSFSTECKFCGKKFGSNFLLKGHQQGDCSKFLVKAEKIFLCTYCGRRFDLKGNLKVHLQIHTGKATHGCDICGRMFRTEISRADHRRIHTGEKPFKCSMCDKTYCRTTSLKNHVAIHWGINPQFVLPNLKTTDTTIIENEAVSPNAKLQREMRRTRSSSHKNQSVHKQRKNSSQNVCEKKLRFITECRLCGKRFSSNFLLEVHQQTDCSKAPVKEKKKYTCIYCGSRFYSRADLNCHLQIHMKEQSYECDLCGKLFRTETSREYHRRMHTGETPFECSMCAKTFSRISTLADHATLHLNTKPYKCSLCPASFRTPGTRNIHLRIHTGKRPHECDICGTDFKEKYEVQRHRGTRSCREILAAKNLE